MKSLLCFLLSAAILLTPITAYSAEKEVCENAAKEMMESIMAWEESSSMAFLSQEEEIRPYLSIFGSAVEHLVKRMDYRLGNAKVTGNAAVVDLSVSAVDIGQVTGRIVLQAAGYLAVQQLLGSEVDLNLYLGDLVVNAINEMPALTTHTSVYLIRGGDEAWKVDMSDLRNLGFLDALCGGGFLPYLESLQKLMEQHAQS